LSALRTGRLYPPGNIAGTHFCWRLSRPQGHSVAGRIMSMKNSNDTIRNRTRDLPACSAELRCCMYMGVKSVRGKHRLRLLHKLLMRVSVRASETARKRKVEKRYGENQNSYYRSHFKFMKWAKYPELLI